ncbi:hypothetical protein VNO78_18498 [Psophocarpus tetragonolobus]|uniref:Uncharacterized protein n=1 Tax=Psophocarpus tetragonolobus TaxID=3891 RepID=A0AAN9SL11_PSOTE
MIVRHGMGEGGKNVVGAYTPTKSHGEVQNYGWRREGGPTWDAVAAWGYGKKTGLEFKQANQLEHPNHPSCLRN